MEGVNMKLIRQLVIGVFGLCLAVTVSILTAIKGWGLEPKSWFWIIGVSFVGHTISQIIFEIAKSKDDE